MILLNNFPPLPQFKKLSLKTIFNLLITFSSHSNAFSSLVIIIDGMVKNVKIRVRVFNSNSYLI